jgi:uncharacterized iron-regulated protein
MKIFSSFLLFFFTGILVAQNEKAFVIYNKNGKPTSYEKMMKTAANKQVVLFGEFHDNPIAHWLEFELAKDLHRIHNESFVLSFEMFEQDQQPLLTDYVNQKIDEKTFKDACRLWPNYATDYQPIVDYARENLIQCVAANIERKYASLLFKKGREALDTLPSDKKSQMADLNFPIDTTLSQYQEVKKMGGHRGSNMLEAQAIKDATMAKFILKALGENIHLMHINGAFHSDFYQGILWYLQREKPNVTFMTISTVTQEDIRKMDKEHRGRADFIICVPESMTRTH